MFLKEIQHSVWGNSCWTLTGSTVRGPRFYSQGCTSTEQNDWFVTTVNSSGPKLVCALCPKHVLFCWKCRRVQKWAHGVKERKGEIINKDDPVEVKSLKLPLKCRVFALFQCLHTPKMAQNTLAKNQKVYTPRYGHKSCENAMGMGSRRKVLFWWAAEDLEKVC